jgi:hypothetical protein
MGSTRDDEQKGTTVGSRYAHRGTRVPSGMDLGKLRNEVGFRSDADVMRYLRSGRCYGSAIRSPLGVADYKLICISIQDTVRPPERMDARNPRLSLARIAGAHKIVYDSTTSACIVTVYAVRPGV